MMSNGSVGEHWRAAPLTVGGGFKRVVGVSGLRWTGRRTDQSRARRGVWGAASIGGVTPVSWSCEGSS